jgi:hypothetical protein
MRCRKFKGRIKREKASDVKKLAVPIGKLSPALSREMHGARIRK